MGEVKKSKKKEMKSNKGSKPIKVTGICGVIDENSNLVVVNAK